MTVSALQLTSKVGCPDENHRHAAPFIEDAAKRGAQLVILPEMYSSGYLATARIWEVAETRTGPTSRWLTETSKKLGIYLGTGFVETDGEDFFNSYMLSGPSGAIIGVTRKKYAEAFAFRSGAGPFVFETQIRQNRRGHLCR
jgi:N-carbamoylputrescine amidase